MLCIYLIIFYEMKLKERQLHYPTFFFRNDYSDTKEQLWATLLLRPNSPKVLKMQNLISEMWMQNPNFSVDDIEKIMLRNKIHPELIRLVIWKKDNKIDENYNINKLIDDLIIQNPSLTKESIKDRMNTVELYYKWKNRNLF